MLRGGGVVAAPVGTWDRATRFVGRGCAVSPSLQYLLELLDHGQLVRFEGAKFVESGRPEFVVPGVIDCVFEPCLK